MKIEIAYGSEVFALPEAIKHYLDKAEPLTLKLFLLLASDKTMREGFDKKAVAKSFAVTPSEIDAALTFWVNAGLLSAEGEPTAEKRAPSSEKLHVSVKSADNGEKVTVVTGGMPNYTGKEIEAIMTGDPALSLLVEECQEIAGKMFGTHEISRLLGMADYLRLDHDSILLLFEYANRLGKCSVAYIEKMAVSLVNEGISTYSALEAYIAGAEKKHTMEGVVRRLAGIKERTFTAKEKKFIEKWCELEIAEGLLELAYEITVDNTGGFSFPYMNKVLLNWREAGYTTVDAVNAAVGAYREKREQKNAKDASFDVNEFFEAALKRSYGRMEKDNKTE